jgi:hypothetical protein
MMDQDALAAMGKIRVRKGLLGFAILDLAAWQQAELARIERVAAARSRGSPRRRRAIARRMGRRLARTLAIQSRRARRGRKAAQPGKKKRKHLGFGLYW